MNTPQTDRFLSEEDLDLQNMTWAELVAWWNLWLEQAQITNGMDQDEYSHGVFRYGPPTKDGGRTTDGPTKNAISHVVRHSMAAPEEGL